MNDFPRLDARQIDIASRWAIRWLVRYRGRPQPGPDAVARYLEQLTNAYMTCGSHLHYRWIQENTLAPRTWRQQVRSLRRNPKRLRDFAPEETLAQLLRFGAARENATDDFETLLRQMEADPGFLDKIISLALEEDKECRKKRLLHNPGGRPNYNWCYMPIIDAAAIIFEDIMERPLGRSTTSTTLSDTHISGRAIGPGIEFIRRLLAPFKRSFTNETVARLIRLARKST